MDDDILARAKLLSQAATQMASELSNQAKQYKAVVDARHRDEADSEAEARQQRDKRMADRIPKNKDIGSLKTTNSAEWSANRLELLEDYKGPTNLDAVIQAAVTAEVVRRRSPQKNKAAPVSSSDILNAVSGLNPSAMLSGREPLPNPNENMNSNSGGTISTKTGKDNFQDKKTAGGKSTLPGPYKKSSSLGYTGYNTGRSEYDTLSTLQSSNSQHPLNSRQHGALLASGASRGNGYDGLSPRSNWAGSTVSTSAASTVPPRHECTHLEEEQYQMMLEIDSLTQEEKEQARVEMNIRMAERGQRKAHKRVEERKQRINLPDTLMEEMSSGVTGGIMSQYHEMSASGRQGSFGSPSSSLLTSVVDSESQRGRDITKEQLDESRKQARERYIQKQREDEARVEANFRAERELQEELKKKMQEKALKLQEITAKRVADYKAAKREQAQKEKEAKETTLALKREKEKEASTEEYIQKMQARMMETEQRLARQKKEKEDLEHLQKLLQEEKLKELAAARQRTENMQEYVSVGSRVSGGGGAKSPSSNGRAGSAKKNKEKKPRGTDKLPRLDMGKMSKSNKNIDTYNETSESESDSIIVSVAVPDHFHRKGHLNKPRNSKSEQSGRVALSDPATQSHGQGQGRSYKKHLSAQRAVSPPSPVTHPEVQHVVQIGKPTKTSAERIPTITRNVVVKPGEQTKQTRFDAFDDDDDDFFDDDKAGGGYLSDDSLTTPQQQGKDRVSSKPLSHPHPPKVPKGQSTGGSLIPKFNRVSQRTHQPVEDSDLSTCVSALTVDDVAGEHFGGLGMKKSEPASNNSAVTGTDSSSPKKKKKEKDVWKMKPIETRPYIPLPQETGGVEQR